MVQRPDSQLLRDYAANRSQEAFAEIARRHVSLVYSAALRRVRDRYAAEDVTQIVFIILAKKASRLQRIEVLSAWLLGVTRLAANDWLKSDARRRRREQAAAAERSKQMESRTTSGAPGDTALSGVLDDALAELSAAAREALVLRFFEGRNFREVGEQLGISEDAAKQRVARGLERLRTVLGRLGSTPTVESLTSSLGATAVQPAPAGLAGTVTAAATGSAAVAAEYTAIAKGVTTLMAWTKAKVVGAGIAAALCVAVGGAAVVQLAGGNDGAVAPQGVSDRAGDVVGNRKASADGAAPWHGQLAGVVRTEDGAPLAGATVELVRMNSTVLVYGNTEGITTTTGPDGSFTFTPSHEPAAVIVRSPDLIGVGAVKGPGVPVEVTAKRWGRIDGTVTAGGRPVPNAALFLWQPVERENFERARWVDRNMYLRSDAAGRVVVDRVLPGDTRIDVREGNIIRRAYRFSVPPGKTTVAAMGETGRTLVGRVDPPLASANRRVGELNPQRKTDGGAYIYSFSVAPDGTFATDDVPPGEYTLSVRLDEADANGAIIASVAQGSVAIHVPPAVADSAAAPFEVGTVPLTVSEGFIVGRPAPPISGRTLDGVPISLADLRGKYVLLHLSPPELVDDPAVLKVIHDRFAGPRLAFATAYLDTPDRSVLSLLGKPPGRPDWPQIVPSKAITTATELANASHRLLLVDADGNLVARARPDTSALDTVPHLLQQIDGGRLAAAGATVAVDYLSPAEATADAPFSAVPAPAADDAATRAMFSVVDGTVWEKDGLGGLGRFNDGKIQPHDDSPPDSAFFQWGSLEGRIRIDLGRRVRIASINTYSWHKNDRAPQVYNVFGSDGTASNFVESPKNGTDPTKNGWRKIGSVDTRALAGESAEPGGRYGVSVAGPAGEGLGNFRYLLFEVFVTETRDNWGLAFFGELDVVEQK